MDMSAYEGATFECACGDGHAYSSVTVPVLRELSRMRLVFGCPNGRYVTCVRVKGLLRFNGFESLFGGVEEEEEENTEAFVVSCHSCGQKNRIVPGASGPRCGRCNAELTPP